MAFSLKSVGDTTTGEVVGGELYLHFVARKNSDVMHTHFSRDMREDLMTVFELNAKHRIGQRLGDSALEHDRIFLLFCQKRLLKTDRIMN